MSGRQTTTAPTRLLGDETQVAECSETYICRTHVPQPRFCLRGREVVLGTAQDQSNGVYLGLQVDRDYEFDASAMILLVRSTLIGISGI
jgi:hypothetical protein